MSRPAPRAMRPPSGGWGWAWAGALLGALLALALFAPARWLAAAVTRASEGQASLVHPRGTVWNGVAGLVLSGGAGADQAVALPGVVRWRLRPRWNGLSATLELACCTEQPLQLRARPHAGGVQVDWQDARSRWPATLLSGLGAPWNTLKPEGTLELSTRALSLQWHDRRLSLTGDATLDATDLSSSLSTLKPMGSYRLTLNGGPTPTLLLSTREGSLQLNGSGSWNGTRMRFSGEAAAAAGREEALSNLLNIIGRRDGARSIITLG